MYSDGRAENVGLTASRDSRLWRTLLAVLIERTQSRSEL